MSTAVISREWILADELEDNPIGRFEDFEFAQSPEDIARNDRATKASVTNCATTCCGPLTTPGGFCGC
ncbi:MAG TPA: hypothetical protein VN133_10650 [Humibacter sp.]|nr:hypothetical protein [Humibacter sp.]